MRRTFSLCCAAATATAASSSQTQPQPQPQPQPQEEQQQRAASSAAVERALYRRLLKAGEDGAALQRCLTVHPLPQCLQYGLRLLRYHKALAEIQAAAAPLHPLRVVRRARLGLRRRYYAWQLFTLRLQLRSWNAISDLLVYLLFLSVCALLYCIYRACRVGVDRAQERYRTMAIPILQTFEAMEESQERRRMLQKEMEDDILRNR
ncbi:hypothetical protein STCU_06043 [Strigomonas culicis]|uniref:Uncharacterized protein n=1 Tax=Strigomonas culicis TaxID=28005 RepID=S9UD46_9TRYP|nr:hypothetical protein STCU_06043 [Strigomonas culicis]|eukprot:EPY26858.1 hypothetical protein STCU_06043 [Strigomonas culicis]